MPSQSDLDRVGGAQVLDLTTTGRKSGLPRTIEIWFAAHDSRVFIMSGGGRNSHWVQNLLLKPQVAVTIEGITFQGMARTLDGRRDRAAWALGKRLFQEKYDWTIGRGVLPVEVELELGA